MLDYLIMTLGKHDDKVSPSKGKRGDYNQGRCPHGCSSNAFQPKAIVRNTCIVCCVLSICIGKKFRIIFKSRKKLKLLQYWK